MKTVQNLVCSLLLILLSAAWPAAAQETPDQPPLVLTSLAPVYQLTAPLLAGTAVQLELVPDKARSMQSHKTLFVRQAERFSEQFSKADAVVSISQVWPEDPLFISVRQANIRVVNIDASKPYSHELSGVAVASDPGTGAVSAYFWLSPSNIIRATGIISRDLQRLYPADADQIRRNTDAEIQWWRDFKNRAEQQLLEVADPLVYALSGDFVYLTSDLAIFVDDYFIKQDIDWSEQDLATLSARLRDHEIKVVIHKWQPADNIVRAITDGGARLAVLDNLETTDDFKAGMELNMQRLLAALPPL